MNLVASDSVGVGPVQVIAVSGGASREELVSFSTSQGEVDAPVATDYSTGPWTSS
jgi:hypothetical protein